MIINDALILGGCTKYMQVPDVFWNKPFKSYIMEFFDEWIASGVDYYHKAGNYEACMTPVDCYWDNYFQENRLNLFKTWEGIRDIKKITKKSKNNINSILVNGTDITDPAIISNAFNNHFYNVLITPNLHFSNYLSELAEVTLTFRPTDKLEVTSIINSLNLRKIFGPASIPYNFVKIFKTELSKPI